MKERIIENLKSKLNRRVWESWFSTFDVKEIWDEVVGLFERGLSIESILNLRR